MNCLADKLIDHLMDFSFRANIGWSQSELINQLINRLMRHKKELFINELFGRSINWLRHGFIIYLFNELYINPLNPSRNDRQSHIKPAIAQNIPAIQ